MPLSRKGVSVTRSEMRLESNSTGVIVGGIGLLGRDQTSYTVEIPYGRSFENGKLPVDGDRALVIRFYVSQRRIKGIGVKEYRQESGAMVPVEGGINDNCAPLPEIQF